MTVQERPLRVVYLIPMALTQHSPTSGIIAQIRHQDRSRLHSEVWSFYPAPDGRSPAAMLAEAGATYRVLADRRDRLDSGVLLSLLRHLRGYRPHILHCHFVRANLYGRLAARLAGVPVVVNTIHSVDDYLTDRKLTSVIVRMTERVTLPLVSRYVAVSEAVRRHAMNTLGVPAEQIVTILNALDQTPFNDVTADDRTRARQHWELRNDAMVIASIGVLRPLKNHQLAIRLFKELRERCTQPLQLLIVGEGPERQALTQLITDLALDDCVRLTGLVADVPQLLRTVDIVVLLSTSEGLPHVIMEAMAAGIPCVVSDRGGIPEAVTDSRTGFVRSLDDPAGIRDALELLLEQPALRESFGKAGRAIAGTRFALARQATEYETLYRSLLSERDDGARMTGYPVAREET